MLGSIASCIVSPTAGRGTSREKSGVLGTAAFYLFGGVGELKKQMCKKIYWGEKDVWVSGRSTDPQMDVKTLQSTSCPIWWRGATKNHWGPQKRDLRPNWPDPFPSTLSTSYTQFNEVQLELQNQLQELKKHLEKVFNGVFGDCHLESEMEKDKDRNGCTVKAVTWRLLPLGMVSFCCPFGFFEIKNSLFSTKHFFACFGDRTLFCQHDIPREKRFHHLPKLWSWVCKRNDIQWKVMQTWTKNSQRQSPRFLMTCRLLN